MVPRTCVPALTSQEKRPCAWLRVEVHLALDRRHDAQLRLLRRRDSPRGRPCTHQHTAREKPIQPGEKPPMYPPCRGVKDMCPQWAKAYRCWWPVAGRRVLHRPWWRPAAAPAASLSVNVNHQQHGTWSARTRRTKVSSSGYRFKTRSTPVAAAPPLTGVMVKTLQRNLLEN